MTTLSLLTNPDNTGLVLPNQKKAFYSVIVDDPYTLIPEDVGQISLLVTEQDMDGQSLSEDFYFGISEVADCIAHTIIAIPFSIAICLTDFNDLIKKINICNNSEIAFLPHDTITPETVKQYSLLLKAVLIEWLNLANAKRMIYPFSEIFGQIIFRYIASNPSTQQEKTSFHFMNNGFWTKQSDQDKKYLINRLKQQLSNRLKQLKIDLESTTYSAVVALLDTLDSG